MKIRPIRICGDVAYVTLTQGYTAIIDAADVPLVEGYNWYVKHSGYTVYAHRNDYSGTKPRTVIMHRTILGDPEELEVDHRDGEGINNRRSNLRAATRAQNQQNTRISSANTSGFKGVSLHGVSGKWRVRISLNGNSTDLGLFGSPEEAHAAYCRASEKYHGEFGRTE
tara:strand:+ start:103 stop:606 length:504 start_codon:yes stop_codon:yes gene_type:complete